MIVRISANAISGRQKNNSGMRRLARLRAPRADATDEPPAPTLDLSAADVDAVLLSRCRLLTLGDAAPPAPPDAYGAGYFRRGAAADCCAYADDPSA
jgi:hypothetical protein